VGGAATGAAAATDRRTTGVFVADQEIELRAMNRLREALPEKNRKDLRDQLQPPGAAHRPGAGRVDPRARHRRRQGRTRRAHGVQRTQHLRRDFAHIRANDTAVTGNVKARLLRDERVPGTKIKVVTESGVVYLMGLLTQMKPELPPKSHGLRRA